ncbi:MAG: GC-type dockerin domain-anchored protein [Phycisphaerae bacterium]|nr:GC-type dockerin domain-anchored protein [Phycisphaerae bacterium]
MDRLLGPITPACPADINADGMIDAADLAIVLGAWGTPAADLTGNGTTDAADLSILLGAWGACR